MSEKFTPGEWHRAVNMSRNGKTARGLSPCRIENEKGVVIAFTVPQKSRQEQIANTNLLAIAPKMYALLKMIADPTTFMGAQTCEELRTAINAILDKVSPPAQINQEQQPKRK